MHITNRISSILSLSVCYWSGFTVDCCSREMSNSVDSNGMLTLRKEEDSIAYSIFEAVCCISPQLSALPREDPNRIWSISCLGIVLTSSQSSSCLFFVLLCITAGIRWELSKSERLVGSPSWRSLQRWQSQHLMEDCPKHQVDPFLISSSIFDFEAPSDLEVLVVWELFSLSSSSSLPSQSNPRLQNDAFRSTSEWKARWSVPTSSASWLHRCNSVVLTGFKSWESQRVQRATPDSYVTALSASLWWLYWLLPFLFRSVSVCTTHQTAHLALLTTIFGSIRFSCTKELEPSQLVHSAGFTMMDAMAAIQVRNFAYIELWT